MRSVAAGSRPRPESHTDIRTQFASSFVETINRSPPGAVAHGFNGIKYEIENQLLELDPVCLNRRQVAGELSTQLQAIAIHFGARQRVYLKNDIIDVKLFLLEWLFLGEGPNPSDHIGGAVGVADDDILALAGLPPGSGLDRRASADRRWH
jgi:hypothetical protein